MQHALSEQIEKYRRGVLDRDLRELAPSDFRRIAWLNCNATSRVWLVVLPDRDNELTNPEFAEVAARYLARRARLVPQRAVSDSAAVTAEATRERWTNTDSP